MTHLDNDPRVRPRTLSSGRIVALVVVGLFIISGLYWIGHERNRAGSNTLQSTGSGGAAKNPVMEIGGATR